MDEPTSSKVTNAPAKLTTPRKCLGSPPKSSPQPTETETPAEDIGAESFAECVPTVSPTLNDCRRSSRKKVIKFDVRKLLNKNRKANKSSTDAPVPATSTRCSLDVRDVAAATTTPAAAADLQVPTSSPSLSSAEPFAKTKPRECQTPEQGCREESDLAEKQSERDLLFRKQRKSGRNHSAQAALTAQVIDGGTVENSRSITCVDSATNSTTAYGGINAYTDYLLKTKFRHKLRVNVKRETMPPLPNRALNEPKPPLDITGINMKTDTIVKLPTDKQSQEAQQTPATNVKVMLRKYKKNQRRQGESETDAPKKILTVGADKQLPQLKPQSTSSLREENAEKEQVEDCAGPVPSARRRSNRSSLRGSTNGCKMTLEETFAEIAAVSSKIVLESKSYEQESQPAATTDLNKHNISNSPKSGLLPQLDDESESICKLESQQEMPNTDIQSELGFASKSNQASTDLSIVVSTVESEQQANNIATSEQKHSIDNLCSTQMESSSSTSSASVPIVSDTASCIEKSLGPLEADPKLETAEQIAGEEKTNPSSISTASSNVDEKINQEKEKTTSVVECDALFKAMDKASAQMRQEEKTKKKLKLEKRSGKPEQEQESHNNTNANATTSINTDTNTINTDTNTDINTINTDTSTTTITNTNIDSSSAESAICKDRAEDSLTLSTDKEGNSQSPLKAEQANPEPDPVSQAKAKNVSGKDASESKRLSNSLSCQDSIDSDSSASQCKVSEASESSESIGGGNKLPSCGIPTPTAELTDLAQIIEDGDYKPDNGQESQEDEFARCVANIETPITTPSTSPQPSNSATDDAAGNGNDNGNDTSNDNGKGNAVRRSHRIKQKPQLPRSSLSSMSSFSNVNNQSTVPVSLEDQLAELAIIDAINEQFLRQHGLNSFQLLQDNYYHCARQVSKENAEMQCDCFLTGDEEAMGHLCCGAGCINRMLMIECGPLCTYGDRCTNKRFQQHQGWPCRVFRTKKKGCGITAEMLIPPGEFIMEYVGEVIDSEEFERRQHHYSQIRNRHYYFMALRGEAIIDATVKGNISRYINHSCDPNAETQKWTVNGELRIGFFSVKTILPGEEITFDYQYQRYGRDAQRCYCESENCRGWIGGEPDSDEGEQLDAESGSESEELDEQEPELEPEQAQGVEAADKKGHKPKATKLTKPKASKSSKVAASAPRKKPTKPKDREYKAGRWLRPSGSSIGDKFASHMPDKREDPDVLAQLRQLNRSGLKNQANTLSFSRCMVRAKLLETRLELLGVLTHGELPCRRLFLDYHGLRLLHAWISESGNDHQLRLALIEALESLPIPNKTMLNDSRVYQSVELWSTSLAKGRSKKQKATQEQQSKPNAELDALRQRMVALLQKWSALPETFRIPKRERIEQMKEHEREADRQQQTPYAATALEDSNSNSASATLNSDPYRQDRFRRDTSNRYEKPKPQLKERNGRGEGATGISHGMVNSDPRCQSDNLRRAMTKKMRRSLFEQKAAKDKADRRMWNRDRREHEVRCEYFGADLSTDPKQLPFYQDTETKEWFNSEDMPVAAPLRCGKASDDISDEQSPEHGDDVKYKLPANVEPLPPSWHFHVTPEGDIFYYNLRDRIPQWEPPNAQQRLENLIDDSPVKEKPAEKKEVNPDVLVDIDEDYVGSLSPKSLRQYIEAKVQERREIRRKRLVSVCMISPRREEDRIHNQQESRKYKENKEKIRRRKELFRRTNSEANNAEPAGADQTSDVVPIQDYLYSSDEESQPNPACAAQPLSDIVVNGNDNARVDQIVALNASKNSSKSEESIHNITLGLTSSDSDADSPLNTKRKLPMPPQLTDSKKKHRDDRERKRKTSLSSSSSSVEKFRFEISGHVAEFLRPYRKDSCHMGRIVSDEDYKFLIKRLSHHITTKEMRYCDSTGNQLACTESVKNKSYEFINQYMRKKGPVYQKPSDEPDY
ncbi:PREDICTED: probable histone-lysine N-methyltransferase CG1716 [Drosophila arizonae]|uniref:[histone H3]-lysine(36) N-trimethyltransferase n=1 Tax=Drosophila arizonae TaxID=7263 RepID=A0ABM1PWF8_DROAR|nr:PREDICTED: probable histone-lysine N-methyltransferase CG1716 [Drosophila arizonae]